MSRRSVLIALAVCGGAVVLAAVAAGAAYLWALGEFAVALLSILSRAA